MTNFEKDQKNYILDFAKQNQISDPDREAATLNKRARKVLWRVHTVIKPAYLGLVPTIIAITVLLLIYAYAYLDGQTTAEPISASSSQKSVVVGSHVAAVENVVANRHDYVSLEKRVTWAREAIDGTIATFNLTALGTAGLYAVACGPTLASAVGLLMPGRAENSLATCAIAGSGIVVENTVSYMLHAQSKHWTWGGGGSRDKRELC